MHASILLLAALGSSLVATAPTVAPLEKRAPEYDYETVTGFFLQDEDSTDPETFDPKTSNFGLKPELNWQDFASEVDRLNAESDDKTSYKVLFIARHGEGIHNVAQEYYGDVPFAVFWSHKDGNGTVTWADARLTDTGVGQAQALGKAWDAQINDQGTPAPESYYASPLDRTCATANLTFGALELPEDRQFVPTIKEKLRETIGIATPNRRSTKTQISQRWPDYIFEEGFTEKDELWKPYIIELPWPQQDQRMRELLDDVFASDDKTWISFTTHSVTTASLLRVLDHRSFELQTGGMLPVLVKATLDD